MTLGVPPESLRIGGQADVLQCPWRVVEKSLGTSSEFTLSSGSNLEVGPVILDQLDCPGWKFPPPRHELAGIFYLGGVQSGSPSPR